MRRGLIMVLPVLLVLMALIEPLTGVARAADPVTVRAILPPINSIDPIAALKQDISGRTIAESLFAGLVRYNPVTRRIEPGIAKGWTVNNLTWTFTLRNDIQWVSYNPQTQKVEAKRPVVAGDFVFGIRRACTPTPVAGNPPTAFVIKGCVRIARSNPAFINDIFIARELGVHALSDQTLEIITEFGTPNFAIMLTQPEFRPVPRESLAKDADWTKPELILTNGPYVLSAWARDQQTMTLLRNPLWPDKVEGNVDQVSITFSGSTDTAVKQLTDGAADFAWLDAKSAQALKGSKPDLLQTAIGQTITVLGFSTERVYAQREAFRRALSQAIDRAALINAALPGAALPMSRFLPPGPIASTDKQPDNSGFSVSAAKASLNEAGYGNCKLSEAITFLVENQLPITTLAQTLQAQWKAGLGCDPSWFNVVRANATAVQNVAHGTYNAVDTNAQPRPGMWIASWQPDYPDANAWLGDAIHCNYGYFRTGTACSAAEMQIDAAFLETDPAKRAQAYEKAEETWFGPKGIFPVVPLYVSLNFAGVQPTLKVPSLHAPFRFDQWVVGQ